MYYKLEQANTGLSSVAMFYFLDIELCVSTLRGSSVLTDLNIVFFFDTLVMPNHHWLIIITGIVLLLEKLTSYFWQFGVVLALNKFLLDSPQGSVHMKRTWESSD